MISLLPGWMQPGFRLAPRAWETLPAHPSIVAQPESGRRITYLTPHKGVILAGYGDWNANTGPVDVIGWDATTQQPVTHLSGIHSEAWDRVRIINGHAYLPFTDPRNRGGGPGVDPGGFVTDRTGTWGEVVIPPVAGEPTSFIHAFDVAESPSGGRLMVCGSAFAPGSTVAQQLGQGVVWTETGHGSWTRTLVGGVAHGDTRFYEFRSPAPGRILVQASTEPHQTWETRDGLTWQSVAVPTWVQSSTDPQPPLPAGYDYPAMTAWTVSDGWLYVGTSAGDVLRARHA